MQWHWCCYRYFAQNLDWLESAIDDIEDDYLLFDCPGSVSLYCTWCSDDVVVKLVSNLTFSAAGGGYSVVLQLHNQVRSKTIICRHQKGI